MRCALYQQVSLSSPYTRQPCRFSTIFASNRFGSSANHVNFLPAIPINAMFIFFVVRICRILYAFNTELTFLIGLDAKLKYYGVA